MTDMVQIESKVNAISQEFGFREFSFSSDKFETAQRALSRFVKAMNRKIEREEIEEQQDIKIKLDLISSLIKRVITLKFAEEQDVDKFKFLDENSTSDLLEYHKNKLLSYLQKRFPKELQFHYTVLKNYQAYKFFFEKESVAKDYFDKLVAANKQIFDAIKWFDTISKENLNDALMKKNELVKDFPELFNTKLLETADAVCKLNKDKIAEINKDLAMKKKSEKSKIRFAKKTKKPRKAIKLGDEVTKSKNNKVAYEDKSVGSNNPFAALKDLKK